MYTDTYHDTYKFRHTDTVEVYFDQALRYRRYGAPHHMSGWYVVGVAWDADAASTQVRVICPELMVNLAVEGVSSLDDEGICAKAAVTAKAYLAKRGIVWRNVESDEHGLDDDEADNTAARE